MLAATLVLVGATSCGSGGSGTNDRPAVRERGGGTTTAPSAIAVLRRAVEKSRDAGTANYSGSFFFDAASLGTDDPAQGTVSLRDGTAAYIVDMQKETEGLVPPSTPPSRIQLQVRDIGNQLYLRFPAAFASANVGNRWVRIAGASDPSGVTLPPGFSQVSARPFLAARLLRPTTCFGFLDLATSARLVGKEDVRGSPTTRYSFEWAPRQWVENTGLFFFFGKDRSPARLATIDDVLQRATTGDVWLDQLGRVRRVVIDGDLTLVAPYMDATVRQQTWREVRTKCEFYDYGTQVPAVSVPTNVVTRGTGG
jgi:hypothetical protein